MDLTPEAQKAVDAYLNKRLVPTGVLGALLGAVLTYAIQEGANASAQRAVAEGMQQITGTVIETSEELDRLVRTAESSTQTAQMASAQADSAARLASRANGELESLVIRARAVDEDLSRLEATAPGAHAEVERLNADAEEFRYLLESHRKALTQAVAEVSSSKEARSSLLLDLEQRFPIAPVGAIVAWPSSASLPPGWSICDGRRVAFSGPLWDVLKGSYGNGPEKTPELSTIKLPDLRGFFLRGLGGERDHGRKVGEVQQSATAMPRTAFTTGGGSDGAHSHEFTGFGHKTNKGDGGGISFNGHFIKWDGGTADRFLGPGSHSHRIVGGDSETRPVNIAVHWAIRIR